MTVGELKEKIADVPDSTLVCIYSDADGYAIARVMTVNLRANGAGIFGEDAVCLEGWQD